MREGSKQRGFTLVELMVVIAIVAILALIVVPTFMGESRKAKSSTEITPMFTELANREQQYKQEAGAFWPADWCPSAPNKSGQDVSACTNSGTPWNTLKVQPHSMTLACSYKVTTGLKTDNPRAAVSSAASWVPTTNISTTPAESWFFILARCDADGDGTYAQFFTSSWDTNILKKDPNE